MKKTILLRLMMPAVFFAQAQGGETPPEPKPDSPLITLAKKAQNGDLIDFNAIDFALYPNTIDFDLSRMTALEDLQTYLSNSSIDEGNFPTIYLDIDGETFTIDGKWEIVSARNIDIELGKNVIESTCLELYEQYWLKKNGAQIAAYENTYYSYFDGITPVLEVFHKTQEFMKDLGAVYDGVSYDFVNNGNPTGINLTLSPNPADEQTDVNFSLPAAGYVTITITDQTGTIRRVLFSGDLASGANSLNLQVKDFTTGSYAVEVNYLGHPYSTTLIVQ